jgi:hypothetical protein
MTTEQKLLNMVVTPRNLRKLPPKQWISTMRFEVLTAVNDFVGFLGSDAVQTCKTSQP